MRNIRLTGQARPGKVPVTMKRGTLNIMNFFSNNNRNFAAANPEPRA